MRGKWLDLILIGAIMVVACMGFSQTWTQVVNQGARAGEAIGASMDGRIIMVVNSSTAPTVSTNYGVTWATNSVYLPLNQIVSSAKGDKWAGVFYSALDTIHISRDFGSTWHSTTSPASSKWNALAMSADGNTIYAAIKSGAIYVSFDCGTNWSLTGAPTKDWTALAVSADGTKIGAICASFSEIYLSTNSGTTWEPGGSRSNAWISIASSADGVRLLASATNGTYLSSDSGDTWSMLTTNIGRVASSADGSRLVIDWSSVYTSNDYGSSWVSNDVPNSSTIYFSLYPGPSVTISADGSRLYALRNNPNYPGSWNVWFFQTNVPPRLHVDQPTPDGLKLSWILPGTNYVLQQSSALAPANWMAISVSPALNFTNIYNEIFMPNTNDNSFYRLSTP